MKLEFLVRWISLAPSPQCGGLAIKKQVTAALTRVIKPLAPALLSSTKRLS